MRSDISILAYDGSKMVRDLERATGTGAIVRWPFTGGTTTITSTRFTGMY